MLRYVPGRLYIILDRVCLHELSPYARTFAEIWASKGGATAGDVSATAALSAMAGGVGGLAWACVSAPRVMEPNMTRVNMSASNFVTVTATVTEV